MRISKVTPTDAAISIQSYFANGQPSDLVASLAHVPEVLQVSMPFIGQILGPSCLSMRVKEIIILGTSALQGCQYCTDTHTVVAYQNGLIPKEIVGLRELTSSGMFDDLAEATLWAFVQTMASPKVDPLHISDAMEQLKQHWLEFEVVEITMVISTTIMLNRYCIALGIPVSESHAKWLTQQQWL